MAGGCSQSSHRRVVDPLPSMQIFRHAARPHWKTNQLLEGAMGLEPFNVYVTRIIPQPGLDILNENIAKVEVNTDDQILSRDELLEKVKGLDGLLPLLTERIDGELMDTAGEQLKIVANHAVGFDNIDVPAATERGIMVTNTPGVLTDATSDHARGRPQHLRALGSPTIPYSSTSGSTKARPNGLERSL